MLRFLEEKLPEAEPFCLLHPLHLQGVELAQLQVTLPSAQVTGCRLHSLITASFSLMEYTLVWGVSRSLLWDPAHWDLLSDFQP